MKVKIIFFTAFFLLLSASAIARPSSSSEESEENENADLTIIQAAPDLFTAILSPSSFWGGHDQNRAWAVHFCEKVFKNQYLKTVFSSGRKIREAGKLSQFSIWRYLGKNNEEVLQQQFVQKIEQFGALAVAEERYNGYVEVIYRLFQEIDRRSTTRRTKYSVRRELKELSNKLYAAFSKLDRCLSLFPSESTSTSTSGPIVTIEPPGFGNTTEGPTITIEPPGFGETTEGPTITIEPPGFGNTTEEPIVTTESPEFGETTLDPIITVEPPGFGETTQEPPESGTTNIESLVTIEPPGFPNES